MPEHVKIARWLASYYGSNERAVRMFLLNEHCPLPMQRPIMSTYRAIMRAQSHAEAQSA